LVRRFTTFVLYREIADVLDSQEKAAVSVRKNSGKFDLLTGVAAYAGGYRELEAD
jgi:hypothetical protein